MVGAEISERISFLSDKKDPRLGLDVGIFVYNVYVFDYNPNTFTTSAEQTAGSETNDHELEVHMSDSTSLTSDVASASRSETRPSVMEVSP